MNANYHQKSDFLFQLIALALAFVITHSIYVGLIRPNAESLLQQQQELQAQGQTMAIDRSFWIVLKDYEQEACFVLMLWALAIMILKARRVINENKMLDFQWLPLASGEKILPEDAAKLARPLTSGEYPRYLVPRALANALQRFGAQSSIQEVAASVRDICDAEAQRLESELAMIRYIAWAIPSIGFIGTVRGIGQALGNAHLAINGDIASVTASLGVAFNSTFIALLISIGIMFFTHQLTLLQERLVLASQQYCDDHLIRHLQK